MAITLTRVANSVFGNLRVGVFTVLFDTSYPTGGELLSAAALGMKEVLWAEAVGNDTTSDVYLYQYDRTGGALRIIYPTGGAAPAALAAPAFTVTSGATAMTGSAAVNAAITETAGRGVELAAATDASTLTARLFVIGT